MNHETTTTKATYNLIIECSCGDYSVSTSAVAIRKWESDHLSLEAEAERVYAEDESPANTERIDDWGPDPKPVYVKYRTLYMPTNAPARTKRFETLASAKTWIRNYGVTVVAITEGSSK
jgi:hypothetical protein